jgi:aminoglycoside phosphotransferase (APT) family kinase protein
MLWPNEENKLEILVRKIHPGNRLNKVWDLKGGVSAEVKGLEVVRPGGHILKMVVRQHGDADFSRNPNIAADELVLLKVLKSEGILVPSPYYLENTGEIFSRPCLVIEFIDGTTEIPADMEKGYLEHLAVELAKIHCMDISKYKLSFLPRKEQRFAEMLEKVDADDAVLAALTSVFPFPGRNTDVLLHGDYWPGNILWNDGKIVSIIDWEDAWIGDPLADLANGRLEILFQLGKDAMNYFTEQYKSAITEVDYSNLPYWDLWAALRLSKFTEWGLDENTIKTMKERINWFISQAID